MVKKLKKVMRRIPGFTKRPVLSTAILGLLLLLVFSKGLYTYFAVPKAPPILPLSVQTISVKRASMPRAIDTVGTLSAKTELGLKAGASGRVQTLLVEAGSWVKEGTLLINIIASPEVRAPFDGYLTDWQVKEGEYVTAGTELIDLVNTDVLSLAYRVPEQYAAELDLDQTVAVAVKASSEKVFKGVVRFISPVVDKKTHTILLRVDVENPDQALWPGMSARVRHVLAINNEALVIPESCLILTMEGAEVFVVAKGTLQKIKVVVGERQGGRVHILSGLHLGDSVVLTRTGFIQEGAAVSANEWTGDW